MMLNKILVIVLMTAILIPGCSAKNEKSGSATKIPTASKSADSGALGTPTGGITSIPSNTPVGTVSTNSTDLPIDSSQEKLVKKIEKAQYINVYEIDSYREQLEITRGNRNVSLDYPQISGLVDKQTEKSINNSITNNLKKAISEEIYMAEEDWPVGLFSHIALSANNILSISTTYLYSDPIYGLLFRVSDGKRLSLKDIFTKGTDYVSLLNRQVELGILEGDLDEGELLYKPFSGIKPDQDFLLNYTDLYIIFRKGEGGFAKEHAVKVPLHRIYDYVDILDHDYSSGNYAKPKMAEHRNNIFLVDKSEVRNVGDGDLWIRYKTITGTGDTKFEKTINDKIRYEVEDLVKLDIWNNPSKVKSPGEQAYDYMPRHIGEIEFFPELNQDGILSFISYIRPRDLSIKVEKYTKSFIFDLVNKTSTSYVSILERKFKKNKSLEDAFINRVRSDLDSKHGYVIKLLMGDKSPDFNFKFLKTNSSITLGMYPNDDDANLSIVLTAGSIEGLKEPVSTNINIKQFFKMTPYKFLHD